MAKLSAEAEEVLKFHGPNFLLSLYENQKISPLQFGTLLPLSRVNANDGLLPENVKKSAGNFLIRNFDFCLTERDPPRQQTSDIEIKDTFGDLPPITHFMIPSQADRRDKFFKITKRFDTCICKVLHIHEEGHVILKLLCLPSHELRVDDLGFPCIMYKQEAVAVEVDDFVQATFIWFDAVRRAFEISCRKNHLTDSDQNSTHLGVISEADLPKTLRWWLKGKEHWVSLLDKFSKESSLMETQLEVMGFDVDGFESFIPSLVNCEVKNTLEKLSEKREEEKLKKLMRKVDLKISDGKYKYALDLLNTIPKNQEVNYIVMLLQGIVQRMSGDNDGAIEQLLKVKKIDPHNKLWLTHGKVNLLQCYIDNAMEAWKRQDYVKVLNCMVNTQKHDKRQQGMIEIYKFLLSRMLRRSFLMQLADEKIFSTSVDKSKSGSEMVAYGPQPAPNLGRHGSKRSHSVRSDGSLKRKHKSRRTTKRHGRRRRSPSERGGRRLSPGELRGSPSEHSRSPRERRRRTHSRSFSPKDRRRSLSRSFSPGGRRRSLSRSFSPRNRRRSLSRSFSPRRRRRTLSRSFSPRNRRRTLSRSLTPKGRRRTLSRSLTPRGRRRSLSPSPGDGRRSPMMKRRFSPSDPGHSPRDLKHSPSSSSDDSLDKEDPVQKNARSIIQKLVKKSKK